MLGSKNKLTFPDGWGREVRGYKRGPNFIAFHVNGPKKRSIENANIHRLKIIVYTQKILHLLYPENFPDFYTAGKINDTVGFTVREYRDVRKLTAFFKFLLSKISDNPDLDPFRELKNEFEKFGLKLTIDRLNPTNVGNDKNGKAVYLDTNFRLIKNEDGLEKILAFALERGLSESQINLVKFWGQKILSERKHL